MLGLELHGPVLHKSSYPAEAYKHVLLTMLIIVMTDVCLATVTWLAYTSINNAM